MWRIRKENKRIIKWSVFLLHFQGAETLAWESVSPNLRSCYPLNGSGLIPTQIIFLSLVGAQADQSTSKRLLQSK